MKRELPDDSKRKKPSYSSHIIYRYHPDANMLSTPKTVSGKTSYTYRQGTANSEVSFLITTEQISSRTYYDGASAISVVFPNS